MGASDRCCQMYETMLAIVRAEDSVPGTGQAHTEACEHQADGYQEHAKLGTYSL